MCYRIKNEYKNEGMYTKEIKRNEASEKNDQYRNFSTIAEYFLPFLLIIFLILIESIHFLIPIHQFQHQNQQDLK
jgi:hypothetical protein